MAQLNTLETENLNTFRIKWLEKGKLEILCKVATLSYLVLIRHGLAVSGACLLRRGFGVGSRERWTCV